LSATTTPSTDAATPAADLTLTEAAALKVNEFLGAQGEVDEAEELALRVQVQAGGCAGFRYALYFDERDLDGDTVLEQHGVTIRIDRMSAPYLGGATIDWKESLEQSGFSIDNPTSSGSCACGESATF
jgi:iron-sulfur cluster assembly accessory protein